MYVLTFNNNAKKNLAIDEQGFRFDGSKLHSAF